jgi:hypothetical protein
MASWIKRLINLRADKTDGNKVVLPNERTDEGGRHLSAYLNVAGDLVIDGWDTGSGTEPVTDRGMYEWARTFPADAIPALRDALAGGENQDILDLLKRGYTGPGSYELERIMRETEDTIPRTFWSSS